VLARRLAAAHAMLADPSHDHLSIIAIAYAAGFGDLSHFNHSFRRRYGATPRKVRRMPRGVREGESTVERGAFTCAGTRDWVVREGNADEESR